jgi:hypothetical protein
MALRRILIGLTVLLASSSSFAGGDGGGPYVDPCDGGPLETRAILRCRDGDPACDMDGACDGTCFLKTCIVPPKNPASCLVTSRLCPRSAGGAGFILDSERGPWLVPVGEQRTFRYHATMVGAICKPARRRCVPPTPPPCNVSVTGDVTESWACQARLIATVPDRAVPLQYYVRLTEIGGARWLVVLVDGVGAPVAATLTSDAPDRDVLSLGLRTADAFVNADNFDPPRVGSLDATLALALVAPSKTQYHEAHGTFDATAVGIPGTDPFARLAFGVHADF